MHNRSQSRSGRGLIGRCKTQGLLLLRRESARNGEQAASCMSIVVMLDEQISDSGNWIGPVGAETVAPDAGRRRWFFTPSFHDI